MTVVRGRNAVVIGAGAGGLCTAARLAHAGLHTIRRGRQRPDRRAGPRPRRSTAFTVNIGRDLRSSLAGGVRGKPFHTRRRNRSISARRSPPSCFFIDGKLIDVGRGGWSLLLGQLTKQALAHPGEICRRRASGNLSGRGGNPPMDWLKTYTSNASVQRDLPQTLWRGRSLPATPMSCRPGPFLTYFTSKGAFKRFWVLPAKARSASGTHSPTSIKRKWRHLADGRRRCRSTWAMAASKAVSVLSRWPANADRLLISFISQWPVPRTTVAPCRRRRVFRPPMSPQGAQRAASRRQHRLSISRAAKPLIAHSWHRHLRQEPGRPLCKHGET